MGENDEGVFYSLANRTIEVGTRVVWLNKGEQAHDVKSGNPLDCNNLFCSGDIAPGGSYSFTFAETGSYPYFCLIHVGLMRGTITVTDG